MKRSSALVALSREHHSALSLAQRARRAAASGQAKDVTAMAALARERFRGELKVHFDAEERWLLPALAQAGEADLAARTLAEHAALARLAAQLAEPDGERLLAFADALTAHVRFEERELFPAFERLSPGPMPPGG